MRLAFIVTSTGLWNRLTINPHLDCPSLQPLWRMPGTSRRLGSGLMYRNNLCQSLVVPPSQRWLTWILRLKVIRVLQSMTELPSSSSVVQVGTLPEFLDHWRSINSNRFVLSKDQHLQLSATLHYSVISYSLTWRLLVFITLLSRMSWNICSGNIYIGLNWLIKDIA